MHFHTKLALILIFAINKAVSQTVNSCTLPSAPVNGQYEVASFPSAKPGDNLQYAMLNISCLPGYEIVGNRTLICVQGLWFGEMPECTNCGVMTEGATVPPWHVTIRSPHWNDGQEFCAGSIIRGNIVISAGHCFWDEKRARLRDIDYYIMTISSRNQTGYSGGYLVSVSLPSVRGSQRRHVLQTLPYISTAKCLDSIKTSYSNFRGYLTYDKFCAGRQNGMQHRVIR
ncbi:uncharacterized protein LOC111362001 [Spodoptera litura]|uniref:Uncharacterized protein LOC111362001 n=1 Tax=Spodoptera litura TaxID=69820 RepID=A0A9J7ESN7_SPOLT|nr:uncharacterized protein LOC111362001 [Spodoptera litura]